MNGYVSHVRARRWITSVNLQALECLAKHRVSWAPEQIDFSPLAGDARACSRLSAIPVLLVDLAWADERTWSTAVGTARMQEDVRAVPQLEAVSQSLARSVLFLTWHVAQLREASACLIDPSGRFVERVGAWSLTQLDGVARSAANLLRLRWAERARYWRALIEAACGEEDLEGLFLQGLQMLDARGHARLIA